MRQSTRPVGDGGAALEEMVFLARSANRVAVFTALRDAPYERHELREATGISRSTLARILGELTDRGWVERNDHHYRTTPTGTLLIEAFTASMETVTTIHRLRQFLDSLPTDAPRIDIDAFSDAVVTVAEAGSPFAPVGRFVELANESETVLELNTASFSAFCRGGLDRVQLEVICEPHVTDTVQSSASVGAETPVRDAGTTVIVHDDLPFGLFLFDERIGICGYDETSGTPTVFVDTDGSDARGWAETLYASYRRESEPVEPLIQPE